MSEFVIKPSSAISKRIKYPWRTLEIGQSFTVQFDSTRESSLRYLASLTGKKLGRLFFVKKHNDTKVYEVGRSAIGDDELSYKIKQQEITTSRINGFPESFDATKHGVGTNAEYDINGEAKNLIEAQRTRNIEMNKRLAPVVDEPWKSPILDPRIDPSSVVKRVEVPVENEQSGWVKKE